MSDLLNKASLVMIPSGYKEDVVYSQIPTDGSGDLSFTRASNGTRINSAGLVEVCPWNLFQQSEDFSNAAWTKTNTTVTSNSITAPNGTLTADLIVPANATDGVIVQASLSFIVGTSYSLSVYGKKEDFNFLLLALPSSAFPTSNRVALFDLNNGTIASSTQSGTGAVITDVGNGWYRCSITITATATTSANVVIAARSSNNLTSLGNGTDGIYIWGAQLNTGELKPYFPTTDRLNVPRLTYQNGGGGCPSLLLEKQSTNLALYSEEFDNAYWNKLEVTITANTTNSPSGILNADSLIESTSNGRHMLWKAFTSVIGTSYTLSVFCKQNTRRYANINFKTTTTASPRFSALFDLQTGTNVSTSSVGSPTGTSFSIVPYGNGWYRISITMIATSISTELEISASSTSTPTLSEGSPSYLGDGTSGIYLYGAQLEASSYPTSYIPTTSSSATRVADACFKTGISSLIGQSQGTMFLDSVLTHSATTNEYLIQVSESASNRFFIYREAGTNKLGCFARVGSTTIYTQLTSGAITGRVKAVFTYQSGSFAFYVNGTQIGVSTATFSTPPTMDRLDIDSNAGAENGYYNYNEAILFKTRLTNAELQAITTI